MTTTNDAKMTTLRGHGQDSVLCRLIALGFLLACTPIHATPGIMNYQAKLTDGGGIPITSPVNVIFTFWDAASGGNQVGVGFSDTDLVTPDSKGVCSTDIGDDPGNLIPASVFSSNSVFLNVNVGGMDITPRERIASVGFALNALPLYGEAYVVPEVTSNPVVNGTNLLLAYQHASSLTPHGLPLSATNHAAIILPPGRYDMGNGQLILDHGFVDLVGLSTKREDQYIFGTANGLNTGVIRQTANDVSMENLLIQCVQSTGTLPGTGADPAAYRPSSGLLNTKTRNCEFRDDGAGHCWSMRVGIIYLGDFENCTGGDGAFGGFGTASGTFKDCIAGDRSFGFMGTASGTFTNCIGGDSAFGRDGMATGTFANCAGGDHTFGDGGTASGTFKDCTGGTNAFGGSGTASGTFTNCRGGTGAFGIFHIASGTFTNCTGGDFSFATFGTASGIFVNCNGGANSFGESGTANGTFTNCIGTTDSFGSNGTASGTFKGCGGGSGAFGSSGTASGNFTGCFGGERAFGGSSITHTTTGTASGTFANCTAGNESFGGAGGKASGTFSSCTGGVDAFGGAGLASGVFTNCTGSDNAFGGDFGGISTGSRLYGCRMTGTSYGVPFRGRMENCFWGAGFTCSSSTRIYGSIVAGTIDLNNLACGVTGTRAQGIINDASNVFGATNAIAINLEDTDVN